jgi:hypothetical protein
VPAGQVGRIWKGLSEPRRKGGVAGPTLSGPRVRHRVPDVQLVALAILAFAPAALSAQSLSGTVTNESARPIEQAHVLLDPGNGQREIRTDRDGAFRFIGVPPGTHRLRVLRIGFQPLDTAVAITAAGPNEIAVTLSRLTSLNEIAVKTRALGVYGTVVERDSIRPIAGARLELMGGRLHDTTDASGAFHMVGARPGSYMLRISHELYDTRIVSLRIPSDTGVGIDIALRPGNSRVDTHMEGLWVDMAQRINWKGVNAAFVAREELVGRGNSLDLALRFAPNFAKPGLVIDERACVFIDGMPRPGATIRVFAVDEVESVEAYGVRGELTGTLMKRWPRGVPCGNPLIRLAPGNRAQIVSIWTRR